MKKLFLLISLSLGIASLTNAESIEQVNLTCTFYETFHWDDLTTSDLKPEDISLIIYPEMKNYTFKGYDASYEEVGNEIQFTFHSSCDDKMCIKTEYSLDRTSAVFQNTLSSKQLGEWKPGLTHTGKCKKTENLF